MRCRGIAVCLLLLSFSVWAQPPNPPAQPEPEPAKDQTALSAALFVPDATDLRKKLDAIPDYVKEEAWDRAIRALQSLLDSSEDALIPIIRKTQDGKTDTELTSLRREVNRIIASLPPKGLEAYQNRYGAAARELLKEAQEQQTLEPLTEAASRFLHTEGGALALDRLATHHLDRGHPVAASLCYHRLMNSAQVGRLPAMTFFKAALAARRTGDKVAEDHAWKLVAEKGRDGVRVGDRTVRLAELKAELEKVKAERAERPPTRDWTVFRGTASRSATTVVTGSPALEPAWDRPILGSAETEAVIREAIEQQDGRSSPPLPGAFPIATNGKVFTRTQAGILAVNQKTGQTVWEAPLSFALESLFDDSSTAAYLNQWTGAYLQGNAQVFFENSVIGTLSADARRVYAIDDIPVPPWPSNYAGFIGKAGQNLRLDFAPALNDAVYHNCLVAIDQETGKRLWQAGSHKEKDPFGDTFFLGPPLPIEGKLYALTAKSQELRLVCLDPATGAQAWSQTLALTRTRMMLDGGRRIQAAPLAFSDGVLVCPTNAGAVFAVDLVTRSILWTHVYREEPPPPPPPEPGFRRPRFPRVTATTRPPNLSPEWKPAPPIIDGGKVIFTAPDESSIHCVSLRDGASIWKAKREDTDLYLADVTGGRVVVVGRDGVRGIDLTEGKQAWKTETALPSGQGMRVSSSFWLPVKGGLLALDIGSGTLETKLTPGKETPGNLLFTEAGLFSQTNTALTAYPLRAGK